MDGRRMQPGGTLFEVLRHLTGFSGSSNSVRRAYMRRHVFAAVMGILSFFASFSLAGIIHRELIVIYCSSGVVAVLGAVVMHGAARYMRVWIAAAAAGIFFVRFASILAIYIYITTSYSTVSAGYTLVLGPIEVIAASYFFLSCALLLGCVWYLRGRNEINEAEGKSIRLVDPWEATIPYPRAEECKECKDPDNCEPPPKISDDFDDVFDRMGAPRLSITGSRQYYESSGSYTPLATGDSPLDPSVLITPVTV